LRIEKINKHSVIPATCPYRRGKAEIQSKTLWIPAQGRNDKYKSMFEIVKFIIQRAIKAGDNGDSGFGRSAMRTNQKEISHPRQNRSNIKDLPEISGRSFFVCLTEGYS